MKKGQGTAHLSHASKAFTKNTNDTGKIPQAHELDNKKRTAALDRANQAINYQSCNTCKHWRPEHYAHEFAPCCLMQAELNIKTKFDFTCKGFVDRG